VQNVGLNLPQTSLQFPRRPAGAREPSSRIPERFIGMVQNRDSRHQAVRAFLSGVMQENQIHTESRGVKPREKMEQLVLRTAPV
jgi:hypothetical protein